MQPKTPVKLNKNSITLIGDCKENRKPNRWGGRQSHLSKEDFVGKRGINVRSVEESDASGDSMVDERYHFLIGLGMAILGRHASSGCWASMAAATKGRRNFSSSSSTSSANSIDCSHEFHDKIGDSRVNASPCFKLPCPCNYKTGDSMVNAQRSNYRFFQIQKWARIE